MQPLVLPLPSLAHDIICQDALNQVRLFPRVLVRRSQVEFALDIVSNLLYGASQLFKVFYGLICGQELVKCSQFLNLADNLLVALVDPDLPIVLLLQRLHAILTIDQEPAMLQKRILEKIVVDLVRYFRLLRLLYPQVALRTF